MHTSNQSNKLVTILSLLLGGNALLVSWANDMPWLVVSGLALMVANLGLLKLNFGPRTAEYWRWPLVVAWLVSLILPGAFLLSEHPTLRVENYSERYCVALAWLVGAIILPVGAPLLRPALQARLRLPALVAALFTTCVMMGVSWSNNHLLMFRAGVFASILLLILLKIWFPLPAWTIQVVNSLLVMGVCLPIADYLVRPDYPTRLQAQQVDQFYSYAAAKKDPEAFARWWEYYGEQWQEFSRKVMRAGPRLQPNATAKLVQSVIHINSRGFRGEEFPLEKGDTYRIVALGESTTFGITLKPTDRTWPVLLEEMIRTRLRLRRPVQVINAGISAITLPENLQRMATDILPLKPDMILSYHGLNGFPLLLAALPSMRGEPPPRFLPRPVKLLGDAEYRLRMMLYTHRYRATANLPPAEISDPLTTDYAKAYLELIQIAATNHIRLALANYSMAVNRQSDPDAVEFYRTGYPAISQQIIANVAHTKMIHELVKAHPEIGFVDTQPILDGHYSYFIDAVHFTQEGREKLAELFFDAIAPILERDCGEAKQTAAVP